MKKFPTGMIHKLLLLLISILGWVAAYGQQNEGNVLLNDLEIELLSRSNFSIPIRVSNDPGDSLGLGKFDFTEHRLLPHSKVMLCVRMDVEARFSLNGIDLTDSLSCDNAEWSVFDISALTDPSNVIQAPRALLTQNRFRVFLLPEVILSFLGASAYKYKGDAGYTPSLIYTVRKASMVEPFTKTIQLKLPIVDSTEILLDDRTYYYGITNSSFLSWDKRPATFYEISGSFVYAQFGGNQWKRQPLLWNAEAPKLYEVKPELLLNNKDGTGLVQHSLPAVGFRQTLLNKEGLIYLNDRPLTLNAVEVELSSLDYLTDEQNIISLLKLLKESYINTLVVKTTLPARFYQRCSQIGLYVLHSTDFLKFQEDTQFASMNDLNLLRHTCVIGIIHQAAMGSANPKVPLQLGYRGAEKTLFNTEQLRLWGKVNSSTRAEFAAKLAVMTTDLFPIKMRVIEEGDSLLVSVWNGFDFTPLDHFTVQIEMESEEGIRTKKLADQRLLPKATLREALYSSKTIPDTKPKTVRLTLEMNQKSGLGPFFFTKATQLFHLSPSPKSLDVHTSAVVIYK
jgi:hypothetical protein